MDMDMDYSNNRSSSSSSSNSITSNRSSTSADIIYAPQQLPSDKMPNNSTSQLDSVYTPPDHFNVYANAFDLSLLPTIDSPPTNTAQNTPNTIDEYIPTTVFQHDFSNDHIKAESFAATAFYQSSDITVAPPSMLSPAQSEHFFSVLPPSPTPSHASSSSSSRCSSIGQAAIKQEYCGSLYPPSPPDSYGSLSPRCPADYQLVKGEHLSSPHNHHHHQSIVGDIGAETAIDIDLLLATSTATSNETSDNHNHTVFGHQQQQQQDHALLREFLQDTTFQRKHNLKPLALDSLLMGGWANGDDIGPVISLALEHARKDVQRTCEHLHISPDPQQWSHEHVHSWLLSTSRQFGLPVVHDLRTLFPEDGAALSQLSDEEFVKRLPQNGGTLHAQLEVWKAACSECIATNSPATCFGMMDMMMGGQGQQLPMNPINGGANGQSSDVQNEQTAAAATTKPWPPMATAGADDLMGVNNGPADDFSDDEDDEMSLPALAGISTDALDTPSTSATASANESANTSAAKAQSAPAGPKARQGSAHIHLWQFLKELLADAQQHGTAIRWLDRTKGVFKIEDSVRVARLWGRRKNRPAMNYDKLSRSIRQYYKKGIMKKTERSQRLVYQFCHPYSL